MANVMALVSAGLGLLGAGAGIGSSMLSYGQSKKLQTHTARTNYEYSLKSARNNPLANRQGLEKAGYNPMLAVQNSTSGANSSWTSNGGSNTPDLSNSISNVADFARLRNETAQSESVVKLNDTQSRKNISEAINSEIKNSYLDRRERAEIGKVRGETAKLENEIAYNNAYLEYLDQSLAVQEKLGMMGLDIDKQRLNDDYFLRRDANEKMYNASTYRSWSDHLRNAGAGIGSIIHGGSTFYHDYEHYNDVKRLRNKKSKK